MKRSCQPFAVLAAALMLSGCMGYRLGGGRPENVETVAVAPVVNRTAEPAIELQVGHALRQRLQFDGRLKVANDPETADAVIETTLTDYTLTPIAFRSELRTTPSQYRLRIAGEARLVDRETGEVLSTSSSYGEALFAFQSDLTSSKRDALPMAASELAKFMVDDLVEQW